MIDWLNRFKENEKLFGESKPRKGTENKKRDVDLLGSGKFIFCC